MSELVYLTNRFSDMELLGKWEIGAGIYRNMQTYLKYSGKSRVFTILTSLKVYIWYDDLYLSTQPELSLASFFVISLSSLE